MSPTRDWPEDFRTMPRERRCWAQRRVCPRAATEEEQPFKGWGSDWDLAWPTPSPDKDRGEVPARDRKRVGWRAGSAGPRGSASFVETAVNRWWQPPRCNA